jgi:hypothetical protein
VQKDFNFLCIKQKISIKILLLQKVYILILNIPVMELQIHAPQSIPLVDIVKQTNLHKIVVHSPDWFILDCNKARNGPVHVDVCVFCMM